MARLPLENGYLFVHIPKTAGTSFRDSLRNIFGDGLYCDYGPEPETSPEVVEYIHKRNAYPEFGSFLAEQNKLVCMSGHYAIRKYGPLFYIKNIMLFLRDPIQRTISQYEHVCRVEGSTESLESFCSRPAHMNLQTRNIGRVPFNLIGFLGLQEFYSESLQMLKAQLGLNIEESFLNINEQRTAKKYQVDDELLNLIKNNNDKDLLLYQNVERLFLQRYKLFSAGKPYMHGVVTLQNNHKIAGWVINQNSDLPVELLIHVDGVEQGRVIANSYRHDLREWNVGRLGYIGFELSFKSPLPSNCLVECMIVDNGQYLFNPFY